MIEKGELIQADLSEHLFDKLIRGLKINCKFQKVHIWVAGLGEPTLHRRFIPWIRALKETSPKFLVHVITNGTTLTEDVGKELVHINLDMLNISVNLFGRETYEHFNRVDKYDVVVENTKRFLAMKGSRPPATLIQMLKIDANKLNVDNFKKFWTPYLNINDSLYFKMFQSSAGRVDVKEYDSEAIEPERYPCLQMWSNLMLTAEGDAYPCCLGVSAGKDSGLWLGNLADGLDKIIEGETLKGIKKLHKENRYEDLPICRVCNIWQGTSNPFIKIIGKWR